MEVGLRVPLAGRGQREGTAVLPARLTLDVVRALPAADVTLELRAARAGRRDRLGLGAPSTSARCAPRTSRRSPRPAATPSSPCRPRAFVETIGKVAALRLARRDAADPHRHPRLRVGPGAADGRDRLLPPVGEGDAARAAARRAPSRPTCRRARCRSSRASRSRPRPRRCASRVRANQVVFEVGGIVAVLAPDRRPVPELPPAAARDLRARAAARRRASSPTSCGASRCSRRRTRRCG